MAGHVAIIGGGVGGTAAFIAVSRRAAPRRITIIDPSPIGFGLAFGGRYASDPDLLSNTPIGFTWLEAGLQYGFLQYMLDRGWPASPSDHMPRILFGQYCRERFTETRDEARHAGVCVQELRGQTRTVRRRPDHAYAIELEDGEQVVADHVILALGMSSPVIPSDFSAYTSHPRFLDTGYPAARLRSLPAGSRVLVVGLRASARDATAVLARTGHRVVMTSPSGRLSSVRSAFGTLDSILDHERWMQLDPGDPDVLDKALELVVAASEKAAGIPIHEQISHQTDVIAAFRDEIRLAREGKDGWAYLMYEGANALNDLTATWPAKVRDPLMSRAYPVLIRYLFSTPLLLAEKIDSYLSAGLVTVSPVYFDRAVPDADGWTITWRDSRQERFDYVVSCTGFHFPRFPLVDSSAVAISDTGDDSDRRLSTIGADLRIRFAPDGDPERIWVLGPGLRAIRPVAHIAYLSAEESAQVAEAIAAIGSEAAIVETESE